MPPHSCTVRAEPAAFLLVLVLLSLSFGASISTAAPTSPTSSLPGAKEASDWLAKLASAYGGAQALTYVSTITLTRPNPDPGNLPISSEYYVTASLEKPNDFMIKVEDGRTHVEKWVEFCDGTSAYKFYYPRNIYFKVPLPPTGCNLPNIYTGGDDAQIEQVQMMAARMFYSKQPYDFLLDAMPGEGKLASSPITTGINPQIDISEQMVDDNGNPETYHVVLDETTMMPQHVELDMQVGGTVMPVIKEDFKSIHSHTAALYPSPFIWAPPPLSVKDWVAPSSTTNVPKYPQAPQETLSGVSCVRASPMMIPVVLAWFEQEPHSLRG